MAIVHVEQQLLRTRKSTPVAQLCGPGPSDVQLQELIEVAMRVPDHGKLEPWRLIRLQGESKLRFGECLLGIMRANGFSEDDPKVIKEAKRYQYAPLVLIVVAQTQNGHKVPELEQLLSAGCVCMNLLHGAHALGFGAQWLTGWAAYDSRVAQLLQLESNERVLGFVHIGNKVTEVPDRTRPSIGNKLQDWTPPND